jgi:hypothetical protein
MSMVGLRKCFAFLFSGTPLACIVAIYLQQHKAWVRAIAQYD